MTLDECLQLTMPMDGPGYLGAQDDAASVLGTEPPKAYGWGIGWREVPTEALAPKVALRACSGGNGEPSAAGLQRESTVIQREMPVRPMPIVMHVPAPVFRWHHGSAGTVRREAMAGYPMLVAGTWWSTYADAPAWRCTRMRLP